MAWSDRINQLFMEPVLVAHAVSRPRLTLRTRTRIDSFTEHEDGVEAIATDLDRGAELRIRCRLLVGLAWLLAAYLNGWTPAAILDAYEAERRPITEQVSRFAMDHAHAMARQRGAVPSDIEDESPAGAAARRTLGQAAYDLNVQQYCAAGPNFGSYTDRSPIIAYDGAPHPPYTMGSFTPSTVPGCRTAHLWLDDRSLYDAMGSDYTLLRFDPSLDVTPLAAAARRRRVPLAVVEVSATLAPDLYQHRLVLSRPDQIVAWRGESVPADPLRLVDRLRGAAA